MNRAMRTGLGLVLTTIALGVSPGLAQDEKQGKPPAGGASSFTSEALPSSSTQSRMPKERA